MSSNTPQQEPIYVVDVGSSNVGDMAQTLGVPTEAVSLVHIKRRIFAVTLNGKNGERNQLYRKAMGIDGVRILGYEERRNLKL